MLTRLLKIFGSTTPAPTVVTKRLIPDPDKVSAGFSIWLRSLRKANDDWMALNKELNVYWGELSKRGLKQNEAGIPFDSPFTEEISKQLNKLKREPHFQGSATLNFKLRQDVTPGWEWYEIRPGALFDPPLDSRKFTCRADLMPRSCQWHRGGFISEKCKTILEGAGLTGLQFNWIQDLGHYHASQWYHAMAAQPLGRGFDNPLINPNNIVLPETMKAWYSYESWRFGQTSVGKSHIQENVKLVIPLADQIMRLSPPLEVSVNGFRQMLRKFLPTTDFAYIWHWTPSLCCNARARDVLIQNGMLSKQDFIPIWIWDEPPEGAVVLDDAHKSPIPPHPLFTPDWLEYQKQLPKKREEFLNNPKLAFSASFERVFEAFFKLHADKSANMSQPPKLDASRSGNVSSAIKLPWMWEKILEVTDDFWINTDNNERNGSVHSYEVVPERDIIEFTEQHRYVVEQACKGREDEFCPSDYLHFASSDGDSLSFDMSTLTGEGDCKVVEWKHDPLGIGCEWPSIIQLLQESIELTESEGSCE